MLEIDLANNEKVSLTFSGTRTALYTEASIYYTQSCEEDKVQLGYGDGRIGACATTELKLLATMGEYAVISRDGDAVITDLTSENVLTTNSYGWFGSGAFAAFVDNKNKILTVVDNDYIYKFKVDSIETVELKSKIARGEVGLELPDMYSQSTQWSENGDYLMMSDGSSNFILDDLKGNALLFNTNYSVPQIMNNRLVVFSKNPTPDNFDYESIRFFTITDKESSVNNFSGTWFDPENPGQGFFIEVIERPYNGTDVVMTWYTFDKEGNPLWLVGSQISANLTRYLDKVDIYNIYDSCQGQANYSTWLTLNAVVGSQFGVNFDSSSTELLYPGSLNICFNAQAQKIDFVHSFINDEITTSNLLGDCGGQSCKYESSFSRLTQIEQMTDAGVTTVPWLSATTQTPILSNTHSGSWYNPDQGGQGLYLEVIKRDGVEHGVNLSWYANRDGQSFYLIGSQAGLTYEDSSVTVPMYEVSGAKFGDDFDSADVVKTAWGTMTISVQDCNNINLTYDGLDGEGSIDLTRLSFIKGLTCTE